MRACSKFFSEAQVQKSYLVPKIGNYKCFFRKLKMGWKQDAKPEQRQAKEEPGEPTIAEQPFCRMCPPAGCCAKDCLYTICSDPDLCASIDLWERHINKLEKGERDDYVYELLKNLERSENKKIVKVLRDGWILLSCPCFPELKP